MRTIESLERRVLMDGDVTATFAGGGLTVTGDDGDNVVRITRPADGTLRVAGRDGTTINGEAFVDFAGDLEDLRANTRQGGEDVVEVQGPLSIGGDVVARLGDGELAIEGTTGAVDIAGDVNVRSGGPGGLALRNDVTVRGDTFVKTGAGGATAASTPGLLPDFASATFSDPLDIDNPYLPFVPGTTYVYEQRTVDEETGEEEVETVTTDVTNDTRTILGVQVRVVHDVERVDGRVIEDTFDWYAQDDNGNVWYFGEDTTEFEYDDEGNLIRQSKAGSFEAGMNGARAGIVMLANPQAGDAYFQEVLVGEAIDRGEVLARGETVASSLGTFNDVLRTADTTAIEPATLENKLYAPGLGLVQEVKLDALTGEEDGVVRLVSATRGGEPVTQVVTPDGFDGTNVTAGTQVGRVRLLGETSFAAHEPVVVSEADFTGFALFFSRTDVTLRHATFRDELSALSTGSTGLTDVTAEENVYVRSFADTYLLDSDFRAFLTLGFSNRDNDLVVEDSSFARVFADGGRGEDTLEDEGGNTFDELVLRRFEERENDTGDADEDDDDDE